MPPLTDEQSERAARALCARRNEDPEEEVDLPAPPRRPGWGGAAIMRSGPRWQSYVPQIKATYDLMAVIAEAVQPS